jgi:hypothetical protein
MRHLRLCVTCWIAFVVCVTVRASPLPLFTQSEEDSASDCIDFVCNISAGASTLNVSDVSLIPSLISLARCTSSADGSYNDTQSWQILDVTSLVESKEEFQINVTCGCTGSACGSDIYASVALVQPVLDNVTGVNWPGPNNCSCVSGNTTDCSQVTMLQQFPFSAFPASVLLELNSTYVQEQGAVLVYAGAPCRGSVDKDTEAVMRCTVVLV